jgi:hypothetical protein
VLTNSIFQVLLENIETAGKIPRFNYNSKSIINKHICYDTEFLARVNFGIKKEN